MFQLTDLEKQELEEIKQKFYTKKGKFSLRKYKKAKPLLQHFIFEILDKNEEVQKAMAKSYTDYWNEKISQFADIKDINLGDSYEFRIPENKTI